MAKHIPKYANQKADLNAVPLTETEMYYVLGTVGFEVCDPPPEANPKEGNFTYGTFRHIEEIGDAVFHTPVFQNMGKAYLPDVAHLLVQKALPDMMKLNFDIDSIIDKNAHAGYELNVSYPSSYVTGKLEEVYAHRPLHVQKKTAGHLLMDYTPENVTSSRIRLGVAYMQNLDRYLETLKVKHNKTFFPDAEPPKKTFMQNMLSLLGLRKSDRRDASFKPNF